MKRSILILSLIFCFFVSIEASAKMIRTADELKSFSINCHTDYSIIIEFPEEIIIKNLDLDQQSVKNWTIDHDLNLMWIQPESTDSPDGIVRVSTEKFDDIFIRFRSTNDPGKLIHTIVLKNKVFTKKVLEERKMDRPVKIEVKTNVGESDQENSGRKKEKNLSPKTPDPKPILKSEDLKLKRIPMLLEKHFSISGGTISFEDSGLFVEGEGIFAGKDDKGLFFQLAGMITVNKTLSDYGFSIGGGYEPSKLGVFLFFDSLSHKYGDQLNRTLHIQARPSFRYRLSDKFHLSAFFAIPVNSDLFTGVDLPGNSEFGYYNRSLIHGGVDLTVLLDNLFVEMRGIFAEGSAYGLEIKALYRLFSNIFISVNYASSGTGSLEYLDGVTNSSRISAGIVLNSGLKRNPGKKKIIFRPDYPMVISIEREKKESDKNLSPAIKLSADPVQGYAPLNVSYEAIQSGFKGKVTMTWYFNTACSAKNDTTTPSFEYNSPGTYEAWVEGKDEYNNCARSNSVIITVWDVNSTKTFNINSSVRSGEGSIDPLGDTEVRYDSDQKFVVSPAKGWFVKNIYCDGRPVGAVTEYGFNRVCSDHTIEAEFSQTAPSTHTITVSVRNNRYGTVSPGTTNVEDGSDVTFNFTPEDNNKQIIRYWVNGNLYNDEGAAGYTFKNVTSDQTLEVEFDWIYYDVKVTLTLEEGGSGNVDPGVGTFTYKKGTDLTFNFNPTDNSKVRDVVVNGNSKGEIYTYKIYDIAQDERIDVYIKRRDFPIDVLNVGGCGVNVSSSTGDSGINRSYNIFYGDDVTFYFDPVETDGTKDYYISVDGKAGGSMPDNYTFYNVTKEHNIRIKCVEAGDPPPF